MTMSRPPSQSDEHFEYQIYGDHHEATHCIVFLHGTLLSSFGMFTGRQISQLIAMAERDLGHKVCILAFTRPGYGHPEIENTTVDFGFMARRYADKIRKLGFTPLAVIGHSGGSLTAHYLALRLHQSYPDIRLVQIAPTCANDVLKYHQFQGKLKFQWIRDLFSKWPLLPRLLSWSIGQLNKRSAKTQFETWAQGADEWMLSDPEMRGGLSESIQRSASNSRCGCGFHLDYEVFVSRWRTMKPFQNSLLLGFSEDTIVPPDMVRCLADEVEGRYQIMDGGHFDAWHPESMTWTTVLEFCLDQ